MGACCGVLFGAVIGMIIGLSQGATHFGRVLMGIIVFVMGGVAGGVFGAMVGALFGALSGGLVIPIRFAASMVYGPLPEDRSRLDTSKSSEPTPAAAPCGRGDEPASAAETVTGEP